MNHQRSHRIALLISGTIGLIALSFGLIEYFKLRSFKNALSELVETKTDGEYRLTIEKSDINLQTLDFRLENLTIEKTDKNTSGKGIHSVKIPYINANFGSLKSFFSIGQVTIEELNIAEPVVQIDSKHEVQQSQFNVAHTIIKIFPVVESILERFNVQRMRITRGNIKIEKEEDELLDLKFIDFLVLEWNMRQLTSESSIQLNIKGQQVGLNKSSFTFSEVEFKYPEHYLIFKNFSFASDDSVTGSKMNVTGKSVLINQLDYNELYTNQRFKLHKIEITEPKFTGRLSTKKTKVKGKDHYEHPLVDILKQTFGEVDIDSAIVKNAQVNLTLAIKNDSVKSNLPHVDIVLSSFKVLKDSSRLLVEEIHLDLKETEVNLNKHVKLVCSSISMGLHRNFTITNPRFINVKTNKPFIKCDKIHMENFKVLLFIFEKKLHANTIELENANVHITPENLKLFPVSSRGSGQKIRPDIKTVMFKNVNVDYHTKDQQIYVKGLHAAVHNVYEFTRKISPHQVSLLKLNSINASMKNSGLQIRTGVIDLNEHYADIQKLDVTLEKFHLTLDRLHAIPVLQFDSSGTKLHHWNNVDIGNLTVNGEIPAGNASKENGPSKKQLTTVKSFRIQSLNSDITSKENRITFKAKNLSGKEVSVIDKEFYFNEFLGKIYQFKLANEEHTAKVDSLIIDSEKISKIYHFMYQGKNLSTSIPYFEIDQLDGRADTKLLTSLYARNIQVNKSPDDSLAFVDSLFARNIKWEHGQNPLIDELEIFNPVINLKHSKLNESTESGASQKIPSFDIVKKFKVHASRLSLPQNDIKIIGELTGHFEKDNTSILCDDLELKSSKSTITISKLRLDNNNVSIDQIKIDPDMSYYDNVLEQTDVISAELNKIRFSNLILDSALHGKKVLADSIHLADFSLHIKRDKRFPDPLPVEKPLTLDAMLTKGKIYTQGIRIANGNITYHEVSAKTGEVGKMNLNGIQASINQFNTSNGANHYELQGMAKVYDQGLVKIQYKTIDSSAFDLLVNVEPFDLTLLNQMVLPLQSMEIKSGYLGNYRLKVNANHQYAVGEAIMTYDNLHLEIFKRTDPEKKNLGSELLTFLADGIILKHDKENAWANVHQSRRPEKSIFNYWVKSVIHGSMKVIKSGKKKKVKSS